MMVGVGVLTQMSLISLTCFDIAGWGMGGTVVQCWQKSFSVCESAFSFQILCPYD